MYKELFILFKETYTERQNQITDKFSDNFLNPFNILRKSENSVK